MKKILITILILMITFSSCKINNQKDVSKPETNQHFVGVWMNYNEIFDLVKETKNESELILKINSVLDVFIEFKINNVFLHTRAFDDAFYTSELYQKSKYSFNADNQFVDFLSFFINCAHEKDIKVHAWINPYRISNQNDISKIQEGTFAKEVLSSNANDERIVICENGIFYNPIYLEIQNYVISGVKEIIQNYSVDGIHFDDYFYLTNDLQIDKAFFEEYVINGGKNDLYDLRRCAVSSLISSVYTLCKNNGLTFSISPSADILKNYDKYHASIEQWISDSGYVDFMIPQIYYGFEHETMSFENCIAEWSQFNKNNNVVIGLPIYKAGETDEYALSGKNEWCENNDIISRQIKIVLDYQFAGFSYYSASYLYNEDEKIKTEKEKILATLTEW